ncbi:MAG TPA: hypothetical protein DDX39_09360 [Bacteroidales bacterium]|nr:MAG: hypothetical protein A2W98_15265 [Bacteroidetes bacterium GWF2_33_38]OFY72692.1 MAG: hypothetical protein A2265_11615 [Bacteroidetes bacterium RIFOXYA12_FULL_33_9]OFY85914.1 MAG: hypothetical protein A2236_08735 [Bacteroidetes bacterium RIFOXYA2_FULL_33_7]HBF88837.1 hypothetical protein [Bacteroidales bacterium]
MLTNKIEQIVELLTNKTLNNSITWTETSGENGYQTQLSSGTITVEKYSSLFVDNIQFSILNIKGKQIESIKLKEVEDNYSVLNNLFTAIEKSYLKVDEVLDSIFDEIKNPSQSLQISDIFIGKWKNSYSLNNKIYEEVFDIEDGNKYTVKEIKCFEIIDLKWDEETKKLSFTKSSILQNDNRRLQNVLTKISDKCYQGFENETIPVTYIRVDI